MPALRRDGAGDALGGWARWGVVALLFSVTVINHLDRQVLSILKATISSDLDWTEIDYANIVFYFQMAFAIGFISWGALLDRIGVKKGFLFCVLFWSIAACAHSAARSAFEFAICRFFLGLGESGNYPAAMKVICKWFAAEDRALAIGLFNGATYVGGMISPFLIPWLTVTLGWQAAFAAVGSLGFVWLFMWWGFYKTRSPLQKEVAGENLANAEGENNEKVPYSKMLRWRTTWVCVVAGGMSMPLAFFYMFWIPHFLMSLHGIELLDLGPPLFIIYLSAGIGSVAGGVLSSGLVAWGVKVVPARKLAMLVCLLFIIPVAWAPQTASPWTAALLLGLAVGAHQGWITNLWAIMPDLVPHSALASVFGLGGMVGAMVSMAMAKTVGHVLQATGSYAVLFLCIPCIYAVNLIVLHTLLPDRPETL
jgi:ACS family hexuronate transporter-like MFS transporter